MQFLSELNVIIFSRIFIFSFHEEIASGNQQLQVIAVSFFLKIPAGKPLPSPKIGPKAGFFLRKEDKLEQIDIVFFKKKSSRNHLS